MSHVHITSNGKMVGTLFLDEEGHVTDDGSPAAQNAIDHTNHGCRREHGQAALDAIVRHLDRSTLVSARHCQCGRGDCTEVPTKGGARAAVASPNAAQRTV
ncbi:MAG TPA: hypothetical protein VKV02_13875 [Acidobacteriaceae bacterium]|nr:hypothetical protein [Acidobacteriaceae bacterium]